MPTFKTYTDAEDKAASLKQLYILPSAVVSLFDELPLTSSRGNRDMKLKVFYMTMHKILESLNDNARRGF